MKNGIKRIEFIQRNILLLIKLTFKARKGINIKRKAIKVL